MQPQSSLSQGLALLSVAADRERTGRGGFNGSRLAEHTGLERSRVSRLTQELTSLGFLEKDEVQAFRLGPASFAIAACRHEPWLRAARAELRALASAFGVSARVSVRESERVILLRYETGVGLAESSAFPGMITPAWCTGAGRALLWDLDEAALNSVFDDVGFIGVGGPRAARSVPELTALLRRDREAGIIVAAEEFEQAVVEWAVPVRAAHGEIIAALSVAGPVGLTADDAELQLGLHAAASRLSATAGGAAA